MRADIGFFRMEQIIQKLFHLADIEAVAGFDSTVAGQIGQGAMTDHGFIRFLLIVQEQADIFQGISNIAGLQIAGYFFHAQRRRPGFRIGIAQVVEDVLPFQQKRHIVAVDIDELRRQQLLARHPFDALAERIIADPFVGGMLVDDI